MNSHIHLPFVSARDAAIAVSDAASDSVKHPSAYSSLLQAPTLSLATNAHDRADVFFSAILGYN